MSSAFVYGDPQFGFSGDFSYPSITGYSTRLDNTIAVFEWISREVKLKKPSVCVSLGDVFEAMGMIDAASLSAASEGMGLVSRSCAEVGAKHYVLLGNHDLCTENRKVYSPQFLNYYPNTEVIVEPRVFPEYKMAFVPFSEDFQYIESFLETVPDDYVILGHFDIKSVAFTASSRYVPDVGVELEALKRFKLVVLGHNHTPQMVLDNVIILGSIIQIQHDQLEKDIPRGMLYLDSDEKLIIENIVSPKIIKISEDAEALSKVPDNAYVTFESSTLTEEQATPLLSRFRRYRFIPLRSAKPVKEIETLKATDPVGLFEEYIQQLKTPLDQSELRNLGIEIIQECQ